MSFSKKENLIIVSISASVIAFAFPFFIREEGDSLNSTLSLAFTGASTVAAFVALYIGLLLYDRFGLGGKFIEKKTETVLALADALKGQSMSAKGTGFTFLIPVSKALLSRFEGLKQFEIDKKRELVVDIDEFEKFTHPLLVLKRSYWMPEEIKIRLEFLNPAASRPLELDAKEYIALSFSRRGKESNDLSRLYPVMTFEEFLLNFQNLVIEIEKWLNTHSSVPIDLKLEEGI